MKPITATNVGQITMCYRQRAMGSMEVKRMEIGTQIHPTHDNTVIHSRTLNKIMEKNIVLWYLYIFPSKQLVEGRQRLHGLNRLFKKSFCVWNRLLENLSHSLLLIVDLYILLTLFCASGDMTRKTRSQDEFSAMTYLMNFPFGDVFCHSTFKY